MKFLFDFFPIVLFFITFKLYDNQHEGILAATGVVIAATIVQVLITWFRERKIEKAHIICLVMVVVLGGITLALDDEIYIKWKPTALYWVFALVFLGSHFIGEKLIVTRLLGGQISLPDQIWKNLNISWVIFFILVGFLNLYVVYNYDTATWVNFKLFGVTGLMLVFLIGQGFYFNRYLPDEDEDEDSQEQDS
jgi:intracellular septation protein